MPVEKAEQAQDLDEPSRIVRICEARDEAGFLGLADAFSREAFTYIRRYMGGDAEAADDVIQETAIRILRGFRKGQFDASKRFRPWYYASLTNTAIDYKRRNKHARHTLSLDQHGILPDGQEADSEIGDLLCRDDHPVDLEISEDVLRVRRAILSLSPDQKAVVEGAFIRGKKYEELAKELCTPLGTVKSRIHAGRSNVVKFFERQTRVAS